jgi:hypothetical protein
VTESVRAAIQAAVARELAELDAVNAAAEPPVRALRRTIGASVVFSLRLDPAELDALEVRARAGGVKPSVFARNLIRTGLAAGHRDRIAATVDQLEAVLSELRAAIN